MGVRLLVGRDLFTSCLASQCVRRARCTPRAVRVVFSSVRSAGWSGQECTPGAGRSARLERAGVVGDHGAVVGREGQLRARALQRAACAARAQSCWHGHPMVKAFHMYSAPVGAARHCCMASWSRPELRLSPGAGSMLAAAAGSPRTHAATAQGSDFAAACRPTSACKGQQRRAE